MDILKSLSPPFALLLDYFCLIILLSAIILLRRAILLRPILQLSTHFLQNANDAERTQSGNGTSKNLAT